MKSEDGNSLRICQGYQMKPYKGLRTLIALRLNCNFSICALNWPFLHKPNGFFWFEIFMKGLNFFFREFLEFTALLDFPPPRAAYSPQLSVCRKGLTKSPGEETTNLFFGSFIRRNGKQPNFGKYFFVNMKNCHQNHEICEGKPGKSAFFHG